MSRISLTPKVQTEIVSYIRRGGFPHMAAEAAGIPVPVFEEWLANARQPSAAKKYIDFAAAVRQAQAVARILAEVEVFKQDPKTWLKSGPGRDQRDSPGWTTSAPPVSHDREEVNLLSDSAWNELWTSVLEAVSAFPDARTALADVLKEFDTSGHRRKSG